LKTDDVLKAAGIAASSSDRSAVRKLTKRHNKRFFSVSKKHVHLKLC